ncbi:hypothetical protein STVA_48530 [Allostella vacuolata]|nr:hypothetical protein STVA_48530 [Stella vacuolata]
MLAAAAASAAVFAAPAHAGTCLGVARVAVTYVGTNPRMASFRVYNDSTGVLTVKVTIGKVEAPLIPMNPLLEHEIRAGRSVAYTFAQTSDLLSPLPAYEPVYDVPASPTALEVGIEDCTVR